LFKYQKNYWWYTAIVKFDLVVYQEKGLRINVLLHSDLFPQFLQILSSLQMHLDHFEQLSGAFLDSADKKRNLKTYFCRLIICFQVSQEF